MTTEELSDRLEEIFPGLEWSWSKGSGECSHLGCAQHLATGTGICWRVITFEHRESVEVWIGTDLMEGFDNIESALDWLAWLRSTVGAKQKEELA